MKAEFHFAALISGPRCCSCLLTGALQSRGYEGVTMSPVRRASSHVARSHHECDIVWILAGLRLGGRDDLPI